MTLMLEVGDHELRAAAERIRELRRRTSEHAVEIGRELLRVKAALAHGRFVRWVESECAFRIRTAQDLMRLARDYDAVAQPVALLVPSTLRMLASRRTPNTVRSAVLAQAADGQIVSRRAVARKIREERGTSLVCAPAPDAAAAETGGANGLSAARGGPGTVSVPARGRRPEYERARLIADLLMRRLSASDLAFIRDNANWETWNRVFLFLRLRDEWPRP